MYKIVYSLKLAQKLSQRGFIVEKTGINPKKPWLYTYLFKNSPELEQAIKEETKND